MADGGRDRGGTLGRDGLELPLRRRQLVIGQTCLHAASARRSHDDDRTGFWQVDWFDDDCCRWLHHDDCCGRLHHDDDVIVDVVDGRSSAGRSPSRSDAAPGQLDQPVLHDDCRRLEHRLGLQVYARPSLGTVVRGVRDARRLVTRRHARHQRDGTIGSIGDRPVHARSTDLGGASPGLLHMGGESHGLLGHARRAKLLVVGSCPGRRGSRGARRIPRRSFANSRQSGTGPAPGRHRVRLAGRRARRRSCSCDSRSSLRFRLGMRVARVQSSSVTLRVHRGRRRGA